MSTNDQADRKSAQAFGFHQLRQACEISTLRQEIARILGNTADLQILIEHEVEQVRQRLGALSPEELQDPGKLSPLLSEALTALIEIREASRRLETSLARRDQPGTVAVAPPRPAPAASPPPVPSPVPSPAQRRAELQSRPPVAAAPPPAPIREPAPPPCRPAPLSAGPAVPPSHPAPASPLATPRPAVSRAKVLNWLMPASR